MRNMFKIRQIFVLVLLSVVCIALVFSASRFLSHPLVKPSQFTWDQQPVVYTPQNLGMNLPWLNTHDGHETVNWLNTAYNLTLIENDLKDIQAMGISKIRSWCQMESVFNYIGGVFVLNTTYAANLDDFLNQIF